MVVLTQDRTDHRGGRREEGTAELDRAEMVAVDGGDRRGPTHGADDHEPCPRDEEPSLRACRPVVVLRAFVGVRLVLEALVVLAVARRSVGDEQRRDRSRPRRHHERGADRITRTVVGGGDDGHADRGGVQDGDAGDDRTPAAPVTTSVAATPSANATVV